MNKEQVIKHGEVIKWFCDNTEKGVWSRRSKDDWFITYNPNFAYLNTYVQNDEYAEYRKALADSKEIEGYINGNWVTFSDIGKCLEYTKSIRVKSVGHEFKIGDWVYDTVNNNTLLQVTELNIKNLNSSNVFKLWKPKEGEWCVFYANDSHECIIAKYGTEHKNNGFALREKSFDYTPCTWDNIVPLEFVNTLKEKCND